MADEADTLDDAPAVTAKHASDAEHAAGLPRTHDATSATAATINRPAAELYAFWRDFAQLAQFMENVESITVADARRSHWMVKAPGGTTVEWDAEVTEDIENRLIAWQSVEGAEVANAGRVEFREAGDRGTVVTATITYDPPAGVVGKLIAKLFQREPAIQARRDLRRFKQLMETGEIATGARNNAQLEEGKN